MLLAQDGGKEIPQEKRIPGFGDTLKLSETMKNLLTDYMTTIDEQEVAFTIDDIKVYLRKPLFIAQLGINGSDIEAKLGNYVSEKVTIENKSFLVFQITGTAKLGEQGTIDFTQDLLKGKEKSVSERVKELVH